MKDRLLQIMQEKHLTSAKLADAISVQRSSISHILSGRNKPSMDFLLKVLTIFPDISGDWLITGQGSMYKEESNGSNLTAKDSTYTSEVSEIKNTLFESSNIPTKNKITETPKTSKANIIPNLIPSEGYEKPFPTKNKTVKRVVIYYDDNSYDELFLSN